MNNPEPAIRITGLRKDYRGFPLKDISFPLPQGYVRGLVGPIGVGNESLFNRLLGGSSRWGRGNRNLHPGVSHP